MTTLVMVGILIFGFVAYRLLPVSDLPDGGLPDHHRSTRASRARARRRWPPRWRRRSRKQFSTIAGIDAMTSTSGQGGTSITLQFALDRNIDAAAQDVQAAISKTLRQLPQDMLPPSYSKVDPSRPPILYFALRTNDPAAARSSTNTPRPTWRSGSRPSTAWRRCRCTARRSTRSGSSSTRRRWRSRGIGIDEVSTRGARTATSTCRPACSGAPTRRTRCEANGQLNNAADFGALIVDLPQRRAGAAPRSGPGDRQRAGQQDGELVQRRRAPSCSRSSGSRAPTPWRWPQRVQGRDRRELRPQLPASVDVHDAVRPLELDPGLGDRREVHAAPHALPRGDGDLPVPAEHLRPRSSRAWRCRCRWSAPSP